MALLILLNNFMHDFSAAGWLFGTVLLWSMLRKEYPDDEAVKHVLRDILRLTLFLMKLGCAGIVGFGIVRLLAYKQYEWSAAAGNAQITLLAVKHVLLTGIFIVGVVYYRKAILFLKRLK